MSDNTGAGAGAGAAFSVFTGEKRTRLDGVTALRGDLLTVRLAWQDLTGEQSRSSS